MELNKKQLKKLERLSKVIDGGDIAVLNQVIEVEEELEKKLEDIESKIENLIEEKGILTYEELEIEDLKGEKGDSYILTDEDKEEIAQKIVVTPIEKIIEKTEVIREIPVVTNQITNEVKEVAVLDVDNLPQYGEKYRDGLELITDEEDKLSIEAIGYLKQKLQELEDRLSQGSGKVLSASRGYFLSVDGVQKGLISNLNFVSGSNVTITHSVVDGQDTLTFTSTGGGGGGSGIGTMIIGSTFTVT